MLFPGVGWMPSCPCLICCLVTDLIPPHKQSGVKPRHSLSLCCPCCSWLCLKEPFWDERTLSLPPEAAQLRFTQQCDGQLTFLGPKLVLVTVLGGLVCISLVLLLPTMHLAVLWGGRSRVVVRSQWFLWGLGVHGGCLGLLELGAVGCDRND